MESESLCTACGKNVMYLRYATRDVTSLKTNRIKKFKLVQEKSHHMAVSLRQKRNNIAISFERHFSQMLLSYYRSRKYIIVISKAMIGLFQQYSSSLLICSTLRFILHSTRIRRLRPIL